MAATSGTFNFVKLTEIRYADVDLSSATKPSTLKTITASEVLDGTFNFDIPEKSVTVQFNEDGDGVHEYGAPRQKVASLGLAKALMSTAADFLPGTFTAGVAGTSPDSFDYDGSPIKHKYIEFEGINTEGEEQVVILYNASVSDSWSGNMGMGQALVPLSVKFYALKNKAMGKTYTITSAF